MIRHGEPVSPQARRSADNQVSSKAWRQVRLKLLHQVRRLVARRLVEAGGEGAKSEKLAPCRGCMVHRGCTMVAPVAPCELVVAQTIVEHARSHVCAVCSWAMAGLGRSMHAALLRTPTHVHVHVRSE